MHEDSFAKVSLILKSIEDEGGKIQEEILMQKLSETGCFQSIPCGSKYALPEAELIIQNLLLSNKIGIEVDRTIGNHWVPAFSPKEIFLLK
jgi:hypothetical protein